jgi:hypothetical protein
MRRSNSTTDRLLEANQARSQAIARRDKALDTRHAGYHQWPVNLGGFEVFFSRDGFEPSGWWACLPGCLPDSDASGPFKTATEAYRDAMEDEQ